MSDALLLIYESETTHMALPFYPTMPWYDGLGVGCDKCIDGRVLYTILYYSQSASKRHCVG